MDSWLDGKMGSARCIDVGHSRGCGCEGGSELDYETPGVAFQRVAQLFFGSKTFVQSWLFTAVAVFAEKQMWGIKKC